MFYGVSMSPIAWFYTFISALLIVFTPIFIIDSFAKSFDEPMKTIITIVGVYILVPIILSYWYMHKIKTTRKGSMIFSIYFGLYLLMFVSTVSKLLTVTFTVDTIIGTVVIGAVSFYMFTILQKSKLLLQQIEQKEYEILREDEIQKQTEAILRAKEIADKQ